MRPLALLLALTAGVAAAPLALATSPEIGWRADLATLYHNVSGTATILDADTLRIENFTYDGGGLDVYFYLGADESKAAFSSGLSVGPQLLGQAFDGSQSPLTIDLPPGATIDGYHAISVWCVDVDVSFGQGTFRPTADFDGDGDVDGADLTQWEGDFGRNANSDADLDGASNGSDLLAWQRQLGSGTTVGANLTGVPEPGSWALGMIAIVLWGPVGRWRLASR